jgi:hypothetical protein
MGKIALLSSISKIGVFAFWLTMMVILVRSELSAKASLSDLEPSELVLPGESTFRDEWMGIYYNQAKIGYSNTILKDLSRWGENIPGYGIYNNTFLCLPLLGEVRSLHLEGFAYLNEAMRLRSFKFNFESGSYRMHLAGNVRAGTLSLSLKSQDKRQTKEFPLQTDILLPFLINPSFILPQLKLGKDFYLDIFDPLTLEVGQVKIQVIGKQRLPFAGSLLETFVLEMDYRGLTSRAWVTLDGQVIKEESPLGFKLVKQPKEEATSLPPARQHKGEDILRSFSVVSDVSLVKPRELSYLKAELLGIEPTQYQLDSPRQKFYPRGRRRGIVVISKEDTSSLTAVPLPVRQASYAKFLEPEFLIQSDHPSVIRQAREIVAEGDDAYLAALKIHQWVFKEVRKSPSIGLPSALEVLGLREGDCNEHTNLFVALARAVGIPAQVCTGLVYYNDGFYYHSWPRVFVGDWVDIDPTLGQFPADATHIQFLEGGLEKQVGIVKLIGKLRLRVLEYK